MISDERLCAGVSVDEPPSLVCEDGFVDAVLGASVLRTDRARVNNATPLVQLHYRAFIPTTGCSAPVLRIGTLALTVLAACGVSLCIGTTGSHVPYGSLVELRATYMPDAARAASGQPPNLSRR